MKRKKLKTIIFSIIVFPGLFVASFEGTHMFLSKQQIFSDNARSSISGKNTTTSHSYNNNDITELNNEPSIATAHKKEQFIYNILGISDKLGIKAEKDMTKWRNGIVNLAIENKYDLFINGFTEDKAVCLTFDDGPDGTITPKVLDTLKANSIKASFFFIGKNVTAYPAVVRRAYNEGSLVLNHSYTHPKLSTFSEEDLKSELSLTENAIYNITGKKPAIIRPPYGDVTQETINILNSENYKTVIWSIDTLDWAEKDKNNIAWNVLHNVRPGDIILMHCNEDKIATSDALPMIIQGLKEKGYKFLTLSEMLHIKAYK